MNTYRTKEGWKKKGREIKPDAMISGTLLSGEYLYSKNQTCYRWELPHKEQEPDSWYLGDGEDYS